MLFPQWILIPAVSHGGFWVQYMWTGVCGFHFASSCGLTIKLRFFLLQGWQIQKTNDRISNICHVY